jgi:hypothetical protein
MRPGSDGCVTWIMRALEEQPKAGKLDDLLDTMLDEAPVTVSDMGRVMKVLGEQRRWRRLLQVRLTAPEEKRKKKKILLAKPNI